MVFSWAEMLNIPECQLDARLEYGRPPPSPRRWVRASILLLSISVPLLLGWRFGPGIWRNVSYQNWQHRCLNFTPAPGTVAYEEDPLQAAKLLQQPGYIPATNRSSNRPDPTRAVYCPPPLHMAPTATHMPAHAVYFHQLLRPDGVRRLVQLYVQALPEDDTGIQEHELYFFAKVWAPGEWGSILRTDSSDWIRAGGSYSGWTTTPPGSARPGNIGLCCRFIRGTTCAYSRVSLIPMTRPISSFRSTSPASTERSTAGSETTILLNSNSDTALSRG